MCATPRWSSRRTPTFIAFAILASIPFVVILSFSMENHSFVQLQRRHENLLARQLNTTSEDPSSLHSMTGSQATTESSTTESSSTTSESSSQAVFKPAAITPLGSHTTSQVKFNTSSGPPLPQPPSTSSIPAVVLTTDSPTSPPSPPSPTATPDFNTELFSTVITGIHLISAVTYGIDPSTSPSQTVILATVNSGFWQNKAAVAGTFVVLALIILGAAAGVTFSYYKKRNARMHTRLQDQLFDKDLESEGTRNSSPGLSINAAPIDPFTTREINYDPTCVQEQPREMSFYASPTSPNSGESTKVVPHALRSHIGRKSYPTSIDSFYGAASPSSAREEALKH